MSHADALIDSALKRQETANAPPIVAASEAAPPAKNDKGDKPARQRRPKMTEIQTTVVPSEKPPAPIVDPGAPDPNYNPGETSPILDPVLEPVHEPVHEPKAEKEMIGENDPEGRQPGDPDDFITLPPELLAAPQLSSSLVLMGDQVPTPEQIIEQLAPRVEQTVQKAEEKSQQPDRPVSDRTRAEMEAGARRTAQAQADLPSPSTQAEVYAARMLDSRPPEVTTTPGPMSARTLAELEAGRLVIARKNAELERNRETMRRIAAKELAEGKPPSNDDLSYSKNS